MMGTTISGKQIRDDTLTGDDVNEDTLILKYFTTHRYTDLGTADAIFVRFNAAGSDLTSSGQVNNKFVAPASGKLKSVTIRSTGTPGSTEIAFMKIKLPI